ncbi:MAG: AMP-binding enzyme [Polaromonas sp.]
MPLAVPLKDAAAIGLPDSVKGQKLVLVLLPREGADLPSLPARAAAAIEQALGKPFRPAQVHCVADLPRTRNGKVMRRVIRLALSGQPLGDHSALENPAALHEIERLHRSH